jgi:hypothetical protein
MARPKKQIDQKTFEGLCGIQCTQSEICDFFDITDKTLNSWCRRTYGESFSEVFDKKRSKGKISLRRAGFELAKKNPAVHIFYCKNFLGMTDKQDVTTTIDAKDNFIEALTASAPTDWNDYGGDG